MFQTCEDASPQADRSAEGIEHDIQGSRASLLPLAAHAIVDGRVVHESHVGHDGGDNAPGIGGQLSHRHQQGDTDDVQSRIRPQRVAEEDI